MRTALALTSTALAVLFATFLAAYCLRLIGPSCAPARDPYPWPETGFEFAHPMPESRDADPTRTADDTHTVTGVLP